VKLRRSDLTADGIVRRRRGRGFSYHWPDGTLVADAEQLRRIRGLAVPPAWREVWICPWPHGHIQAIGVDVAGRRQYRYHDAWRVARDAEKFDRSLACGAQLPRLRSPVETDLEADGLCHERVLAVAVRLLDVGSLRIGGKEYARDNNTYGLTTLRRDHVRVHSDAMRFRFVGKAGQEQRMEVVDGAVAEVLRSLRARRGAGSGALFGWRSGRRWTEMHPGDVNERIKDLCGEGFTAKCFRTWNATTMVAGALAEAGVAPSQRRRSLAVREAITMAADHLGNSLAVCRRSYLDPRVVDAYDRGDVVALPAAPGREDVEAALLALLAPASAPMAA
jgi:DNA topoisomerase IB